VQIDDVGVRLQTRREISVSVDNHRLAHDQLHHAREKLFVELPINSEKVAASL